uniref:Uncharacterized protein n=1 Tax=Lepeophtheirus salmonis TaxID=72036 RepID=A0A0K2SV31_LEPSM
MIELWKLRSKRGGYKYIISKNRKTYLRVIGRRGKYPSDGICSRIRSESFGERSKLSDEIICSVEGDWLSKS